MKPQSARSRSGPRSVAVGLLLYGLAGFIFLGLAGRDLGAGGVGPLSVAWTGMNALGIGLFGPVEQEVSRLTAANWDRKPSLRHVTLYLGVVAGVLVTLGVLFGGAIALRLLGGESELLWWCIAGLITTGPQMMIRGRLSGVGALGSYGLQLALDGFVRIAVAIVAYIAPSSDAGGYAAALLLGPLISAIVTVGPAQLTVRGILGRGIRQVGVMPPLVLASLSAQLLANIGPFAISALAGASDPELVGRFTAGITIGRMHLFLFAIIQAVFLPALSAAHSRGQSSKFAGITRKLLLVTSVLGIVGVVFVGVLGNVALRVVYGDDFYLDPLIFTLIAASASVFMLSQALTQLLLSIHADKGVAIGWMFGLATTVAALFIPISSSARVALSLVIGSAVSFAVHLLFVRSKSIIAR